MNNIYLVSQANAWLKRKIGPDEIVRIVPDTEIKGKVLSYKLYIAYGTSGESIPDKGNPDYLGTILFDDQGYWIYDGVLLAVAEKEQLARFIINHPETI
jgi:hypothetical protein